MKNKGLFITLEGIDGSGSTTQLGLLYNYLRAADFSVVRTREPGGTNYSEKLREVVKSSTDRVPLAELLTFEAARADVTEKIIRPALEEGNIVLSDRYTDSSLAYQGFGRGIPLEVIQTLNKYTSRSVRPDLTLLYDLPVEDATPANRDYFEALGVEFQNRVREGYLRLAINSYGRVKVVERVKASSPEESIERTFEEGTMPFVRELLAKT